MKSILDPSFKYTNSASTDLRQTFARVRREQKAQEAKAQADRIEQVEKVRTLKTGAAK